MSRGSDAAIGKKLRDELNDKKVAAAVQSTIAMQSKKDLLFGIKVAETLISESRERQKSKVCSCAEKRKTGEGSEGFEVL